ncbi:hypothetical protein ACX8Z9_01625 [Arthrobacter halodurans]|uniref:MarR family transcriptional regulator n=1 Tax=Arthrobacter halodurans TaxID=516699 RepID=A0ABV4UJD9_9MICC
METYWYDLHEAFARAEATRTPLRAVCQAIHGRRACSRLWGAGSRVGVIDTGHVQSGGHCPKLRFQDGSWIWLDLTIRMVMDADDLEAQLVADALAVRDEQGAAELARSTHLAANAVAGALGRLEAQGAVRADGLRWSVTARDRARRPFGAPGPHAEMGPRLSMVASEMRRGEPARVAS